jgi:hypothetical protein
MGWGLYKNIGIWWKGLAPVKETKERIIMSYCERTEEDNEVAYGGSMKTTAKLYPNGQLTIETYSRTRALFGALRGRVIIICIDGNGVPHWFSDVLKCSTRCAIFDPTCSSEGLEVFTPILPEPVGRLTESLDIIHFDEAKFRELRDQFKQMGDFIRGAAQIASEIKELTSQLPF